MKKTPLGASKGPAVSVLTAIVLATLTITAAMAKDHLCPPVQIVPLPVGVLKQVSGRYTDNAYKFGSVDVARLLRNGTQAKRDFYDLWEHKEGKPIHTIYLVMSEPGEPVSYHRVTSLSKAADVLSLQQVDPGTVPCSQGTYVLCATGEAKELERSSSSRA